MATRDAFQIQYREEIIPMFEQSDSLLRMTVTQEAQVTGNQCRFLVGGSQGETTTTRGSNGRIPAGAPQNEVYTATLTEEHAVKEETGFDIFSAQGNQIELMQRSVVNIANRKFDEQIIEQLETATLNTGGAVTGDLDMVVHAQTILGNNEIEFDGNICLVATHALLAYLLKDPSFASADFNPVQPLAGGGARSPHAGQSYGYYVWNNLMVIVHPNLPGKGTNAEKCFMYHKSAIGHACATEGMRVVADYDKRHDYSYSRASMYCGGKLLQNPGVVILNHDGAAFAAA